jgi:hypothetical protein
MNSTYDSVAQFIVFTYPALVTRFLIDFNNGHFGALCALRKLHRIVSPKELNVNLIIITRTKIKKEKEPYCNIWGSLPVELHNTG